MARILIIEDNPAVLTITKDLLEAANFEVVTAEDGEKGREQIEKAKPDLLVLDLGLPDDFGLDICREVKKKYPDLLIFVLTALGGAKYVVAGLEAGADEYLGKPFNQREFIARVQLLLRKAGKK